VKYLPTNTLAYYNAMPQGALIDVSAMPISVLAKSLGDYMGKCGEVSPDHEAVRFYCLNHYASLVRKRFTNNESLPEWAEAIMYRYTQEVAKQGSRQLFYLLAITTRESRHLKSMPSAWYEDLALKFGQSFHDLITTLPSNEHMAVSKLVSSAPSNCNFGQFMAGISHVFFKGKWSSGFGGKKWGAVAECLRSFVMGKTTLEMMVDTAYTLAHNNGPIYNKGMMYKQYSGSFLKILDVQRSGQIPELMADPDKYDIKFPSDFDDITALAFNYMPEEFGAYVDWYKVEALGSNKQYPYEKLKQDAKHPKKIEPLIIGKVSFVSTGEVFETGLENEEVAIMKREAA
jgi:hypothetical protein